MSLQAEKKFLSSLALCVEIGQWEGLPKFEMKLESVTSTILMSQRTCCVCRCILSTVMAKHNDILKTLSCL